MELTAAISSVECVHCVAAFMVAAIYVYVYNLWPRRRLTYANTYTKAMSADRYALRGRLMRSPWNTFLGDISHRNIDSQWRPGADLAVLSINLALSVCYVNYNLFDGFEPKPVTLKTFGWHHLRGIKRAGNTTAKPKAVTTTDENETKPTVTNERKEINFTSEYNFYLTTPQAKQKKSKIYVKQFNMKCPENERPSSIGTYEIPTQRDLVLFTQRTLLKIFKSYHEKTLLLLKDIKEATRATVEVEKKCYGRGKTSYKLCVKQVNKKFVTVTKELVQSLERQDAEVTALTEGKICNLTSMKTNPIQLIKILAMDEATLDFALPAFLRLLGGCTVHCNKPAPPDHRPRLRQMTDQELVVRHLLTSKNYLQLLKDKYV